MIPTAVPLLNIMYKTFYNERDYRQWMEAVGDFGFAGSAPATQVATPKRVPSIGSRLRAAVRGVLIVGHTA
jgi:hypothetical protein